VDAPPPTASMPSPRSHRRHRSLQGPSNVPASQRVDFQTAQRLDARVPPQITATDDFLHLPLQCLRHRLRDAPHGRRETGTAADSRVVGHPRSPSTWTRPTTSSRPASPATSSD
jgi:hypothetical protein